MASLYRKGNKIYISWYDPLLQKSNNKSLGLEFTETNLKKAKTIAKQFEKELEAEKDKIRNLNLKKDSIDSAFQHFLKNNQHKNHKTIKDYHRFYKQFTSAFKEDQPCTTISKLKVESWLNDIRKLDMKPNSIFGYYKQLSHFLRFLFEYNYLPMFIINRDVKPKPEIGEIIVISMEDLAYIFKMSETLNKSSNFQNTLKILYYTGLRASDVLSIEIENIDIENRTLKYYSPKRKMHRQVGFHEDLVPVFDVIKKTQITGKVIEYKNVESLQRAINRFFSMIDIKSKKYTSRTFRKTFITISRKRGMDESVVKELVGHAHSSTTDRFYNRIDTDLMKEELKKFLSIQHLPYTIVQDRVLRLLEKLNNLEKN